MNNYVMRLPNRTRSFQCQRIWSNHSNVNESDPMSTNLIGTKLDGIRPCLNMFRKEYSSLHINVRSPGQSATFNIETAGRVQLRPRDHRQVWPQRQVRPHHRPTPVQILIVISFVICESWMVRDFWSTGLRLRPDREGGPEGFDPAGQQVPFATWSTITKEKVNFS